MGSDPFQFEGSEAFFRRGFGVVQITVRRVLAGPAGLLFLFGVLLALTPAPAHAYLDPVSGSIILQVLAAGALTAILTVKRFWAGIKEMGSRFLRHRDES